ncbi:MAG: hypothetical protein ABJB47_10045, partial [Actinomycetota bacterium]
MSDAWMPGVGHLRAAADGGHLKGGAPRAVWQALGADPGTVSARSAAERLREQGRASHLTWNPESGEIVQLVSILRAGRCLGSPENVVSLGAADDAAGLPAPPAVAPVAASSGPLAAMNSEGRACAQICVVAFAWEPFTAGPMRGLAQILDWLDSWGIPRQWPAGCPAAFPHGHASGGNRRLWARGGHFGASQVPGWQAAGPGAIDVERLTGRTGPGSRRPRPAAPAPARAGHPQAGVPR